MALQRPNGKKRPGHSLRNWRGTIPTLACIFRVVRLPEVGTRADIYLTEAVVYNRIKDAQSATGQWFAELLKENPWYKDVVPDV